MKNFSKAMVTATPNYGVMFSDCVKEAAIMAITEDRVVTFTHNSRTIVVDPNDLLSFISMACQEGRE